MLVEKAKKGNKSALNTLLTQNYELLKGYALKMTGDPHLSQDIIQETMLKAVVHIERFKPRAKFSTWLITIATNVYRDTLRKNRNTVFIDETMEASVAGLEETALNNIKYKVVTEILMGLPYEKRSVFILKHYYGYSYEEIAEILKCPIGTVRSRLHNGIKQILSEMEKRRMLD